MERRADQLKKRSVSLKDCVSTLTGDPAEIHLAHLFQEQLCELQRELSDFRNEVLVITPDFKNPLYVAVQQQDRDLFEISANVKKLLYQIIPIPMPVTPSSMSVATDSDSGRRPGVKLPKMEVPTFNGDRLQWQTFWEQFDVTIHSRTEISDTEKLAYLRHAL